MITPDFKETYTFMYIFMQMTSVFFPVANVALNESCQLCDSVFQDVMRSQLVIVLYFV